MLKDASSVLSTCFLPFAESTLCLSGFGCPAVVVRQPLSASHTHSPTGPDRKGTYYLFQSWHKSPERGRQERKREKKVMIDGIQKDRKGEGVLKEEAKGGMIRDVRRQELMGVSGGDAWCSRDLRRMEVFTVAPRLTEGVESHILFQENDCSHIKVFLIIIQETRGADPSVTCKRDEWKKSRICRKHIIMIKS